MRWPTHRFWLNPGIYAVHFDRSDDLRDDNIGLGIALGVVAGAVDGYPNYRDGGWFLAPLPLLAIEGRRLGVNLSVIPTIRDRLDGAIAIQVKLRIW